MPDGNVVVESHDAPTAGLPCLGTCVPDPGSAQVDCSVSTKGITKLPIVTFDDPDSMGDFSAQDFYVYTDGTAVAWNVYGSAPNLVATVAGYVPKTQIVDYCGAGNAALHLVGGYFPYIDKSADCVPVPSKSMPSAFRAWGGGMGIPMQKLNNSDGMGDAQKGLCGPQPNGGPPPHPELCPPATEEYAVRVGALDVSEFDGISFWGRRGPNSQAGIGVTVGDRFTDDDISYLTYRNDPTAPRHCERVKECSCADLTQCEFARDHGAFNINTSICAQDQPGYYCAGALAGGGGLAFQAINGQGTTFYCSGSPGAASYKNECNQAYAAYPNDIFHLPDGGTVPGPNGPSYGDQQFFNRPCTPHTRADGYGASYCFDPATDPPPADPTQTCGDHWMKMVDLTTDWQFFKVPFTDLRQQGFAKKSELLDLHSVSVVRFTWSPGWIDYWIDEVSFYHDTQ